MFHLLRLTECPHWEENETARSLLANPKGGNQYSFDYLTGGEDYLAVVFSSSSNKERDRVAILSISHPDTSLEDATLRLPTSSPVISLSTHLNTGLLVQQDGQLSAFSVRGGRPHIESRSSLLSCPDNEVADVAVSADNSTVVWSESRKGAEGGDSSCSIHARLGEEERSLVLAANCPLVQIIISGTVVAFIPKSNLYAGVLFLYSITEKVFKVFEFSNLQLTNLQTWKRDLSFRSFLLRYSVSENKNERVKLVAVSAGTGINSFYIWDANSILWNLSVDERNFLSKERVCSLNYNQDISDGSLLIMPYQQVIILCHGNRLRIFEPTQGVCVQSEELEEPISLHSYHFNNYDKFLISTAHNIYLPENLPLRDQISHIHTSVPEETRISRLIHTPSLIHAWNTPSLQIKSILEAAHLVIKQKPDCIGEVERAELESLFSQLNHAHIENPTILLNLFSKFPKFQTALHIELSHYQNSLENKENLNSVFTPYYYREDFSNKLSAFQSLSYQQNDIFTANRARESITASYAYPGSCVKQEVLDHINSVVTDSISSFSGYSYNFEYLCLVSPEEVLEAVKLYFSQEYKTSPDRKIHWKKLFHSSQPLQSAMKDSEILPSLFETICRLVFQYDPDYLIPFITQCQYLLDVDYSKEPAFVRKSSLTQMYQRVLDSLPDMSNLLSCTQELTTQRAITYYKVLTNSKTANSGYKCIIILAAVSEWKAALAVLQQYTQNDYLHYYLFTTLAYLMNQAGVLTNYSQELHRLKTDKFSVGEHLQMFNQLSKFHSSDQVRSEMGCNVAPFLKILIGRDGTDTRRPVQTD